MPRLLLLLLALMLPGCASLKLPSFTDCPAPPPSLTVQCPDLPMPASGTNHDILATMVEWAELYNDCAAGKQSLIRACEVMK